MPVALPTYLGTTFEDCPPGHRFGLYFDGWEVGWHKPSNKTQAFSNVVKAFPEHSRKALAALRARQLVAAEAIGEAVLIYPAKLSAPLPTGLGNEHPLENGFAFLNPYGLPYLAGSGVKGVLRCAAEELASGDWGDSEGWNQATIDILFGPGEDRLAEGAEFRRGALAFWDLFFAPTKKDGALLKVEIMTPHHSGYLQGAGTPHANESPTPIPFLAVAAGCEATLFVQCDPAQIPAEQSALRSGWKPLLSSALAHAGEWLGFGAKTSVGYGRLELDQRAQADANEKAEQRARNAELDKLTPRIRSIKEFISACEEKLSAGIKDKLNAGLHQRAGALVNDALKDETCSLEEKLALADALDTWLPKVIEKLDKKDDWKDARKKLKLAQLRPQA
jgi:CRISPR-associated protein Cmr6